MCIETLRNFLLWCLILNAGMLTVWFILFAVAHDWIYRMHSRWFPIPVERFNAIHYAIMAAFKIAMIVLNLVPYLALLIVGR